MKRVYGSYLDAREARKVVNELLEQGFTRDEIKVVSNENLSGKLDYLQGNEKRDERGLWEKLKDAFTFDEYHDEYLDKDLDNDDRVSLDAYRANLESGEIVVLVEDRPAGVAGHTGAESVHDEEVIDLKKEKLNIDKQEVQTGQVNVKKVVKEETQTIEVPVKKEEIVIERRPAGDREVRDGETIGTGNLKDGEEIHIPIKEEKVNVSKSTVVGDEVVIKKDTRVEDETVSETVRHEEVVVEGDAKLKEDLERKDR